MANTELANCPDCGASYAMVGRVHRCVRRIQNTEHRAVVADTSGTYKYRDADKRRSYMRDYMRRKRNAVQENRT